MRKILIGIAAAAAAAAGGCAQQVEPARVASRSSVLDVHPVHRTPAFSMAPDRVTPPAEPRAALVTVVPGAAAGSAPVKTETPKASKTKTASARGQAVRYIVKKGDTLFHIAKTAYGDGKKWTLIASANPGLTPQSLKVGQSLMIPKA